MRIALSRPFYPSRRLIHPFEVSTDSPHAVVGQLWRDWTFQAVKTLCRDVPLAVAEQVPGDHR